MDVPLQSYEYAREESIRSAVASKRGQNGCLFEFTFHHNLSGLGAVAAMKRVRKTGQEPVHDGRKQGKVSACDERMAFLPGTGVFLLWASRQIRTRRGHRFDRTTRAEANSSSARSRQRPRIYILMPHTPS
jgi:hypothetical protein